MTQQPIAKLLLAGALFLAACSSLAVAASNSAEERIAACPTSVPDPETKLYGDSEGLQVFISGEGVWNQLPPGLDGGYGQKVFWKYPGYSVVEDPTPAFKLVGEQIDGDGYFVRDGLATNAYAADLLGSAILTGVEFPQTGCWQLTGEYRGDTLTFVVWVGGQSN